MPKKVDHTERRAAIARALWQVVDRRGWSAATMRTVAQEANVSLGQLQHYFRTRQDMLTFAMAYASEQSAGRVAHQLERGVKSPRDVLRTAVIELLPLRPQSRATSRLNAAFVLEALHDSTLRQQASQGLRDGRSHVAELIRTSMAAGLISAERDADVETDRVISLTGLAPLIEFDVVTPEAALAVVDRHLDELFTP
ncbi:MAG: TetR/AcrR family transcriptional regulator [Gordonia sp. (in: high G+C Gram-positive bacteria)]|uniref:TetR/AcrR family transcriptional regulator n=1 Tax=Gordonia sp. (in: high G+C Gram-positive bacteria) TaxID=84139 RepID=UPI0039E628FA